MYLTIDASSFCSLHFIYGYLCIFSENKLIDGFSTRFYFYSFRNDMTQLNSQGNNLTYTLIVKKKTNTLLLHRGPMRLTEISTLM